MHSRARLAGQILCAVGWLWTAYECDTIGIDVFDKYLKAFPGELWILAIVLTILTCWWMENLLPIRGVCALGAVIQDDGTVGTLTVDGDVDLSKGGAVRLVGDVSKLRAGHYDLIVSDAIEAAKAGTWTPEVRKANGLLLTVRIEDGAVELIASPAGTTFIFR